MADYQPFPITTLKTGFFNYVEPWIRPEDAFEPLENSTVYRGAVSKRRGFVQLGNTLSDNSPVMGIMRYQNESTGVESLVVATTKNFYLFDNGSQTFNLITSIAASTFWSGNVISGPSTIPLSGSIPTFWTHLTPTTVVIKAFLTSAPTTVIDQVTDDGVGGWGAPTTSVLFTGTGTINYVTGAVNFGTDSGSAVSVNLSITATTTGSYFTGTILNFFNWTNWQPTDPQVFTSSTSYLYMTNNIDPITLFDGTSLSRPIFYINSTMTDYVTKTLDVKVFRNRLMFILPKLLSTSNPINQAIFWSQQYNPMNFIQDIQGNGGSVTASTGDIIQSFRFLRDSCIVRFSKSVWIFRYTGNDFTPFVFNKINSTKRTNCPYASIEYDERETGIGSTGITACDGVNVQRFDINIIDFYETQMSEIYYSQAFSQRYDNNSESWTLFVSQANQNPLVGGIAPGSDKALVYNFVENTWATHIFTTPLTCLGLFQVVKGLTWADATFTWQSQDKPWFSYSNQKGAPSLLAGDTTGHVWWMDNGDYNLDAVTTGFAGTPILANIKSTQWNPFIQVGQKVQFGYIDFYYARNDDCIITVQFFVDNSGSPNATRTLTLDANGTDGNAGSDFAMKRIYINAMGEFLRMNLSSNSAADFQINGFVLWCRPAGRLTP